MSDLPAIFIPSGVHGEPMLGTADMWADPEGRYVKASDYLALLERCRLALQRNAQIERLYSAGVREITLVPPRDEVRCSRCDNYFGGHATGGDDICDCHSASSQALRDAVTKV